MHIRVQVLSFSSLYLFMIDEECWFVILLDLVLGKDYGWFFIFSLTRFRILSILLRFFSLTNLVFFGGYGCIVRLWLFCYSFWILVSSFFLIFRSVASAFTKNWEIGYFYHGHIYWLFADSFMWDKPGIFIILFTYFLM